MFNNQEPFKVDENTQKALDIVFNAINKKHGNGTVFQLKDHAFEAPETISTRSLSLDIATGIGGFPIGKIVEVYGPPSSGKTTVCLQVVAEAQKRGGKCAYIDAEHALDVNYARNLGVDIDSLILSQPDNGEQALEVVENLTRSGVVRVVVIDSVAALVPKAELEAEMGSSTMGVMARLMSQAMRKLTAIAHETGTLLIFINQMRMKIGVMFGNPETTSGGEALKFYSSLRLDIRKTGTEKDSMGEATSNTVKVKVVKNKLAPPFREAEFSIIFGEGIDYLGELLDQGVKLGIISKAASWFNYGDVRLGQGGANVKAMLKSNPELLKEIEGKVFAHLGNE